MDKENWKGLAIFALIFGAIGIFFFAMLAATSEMDLKAMEKAYFECKFPLNK